MPTWGTVEIERADIASAVENSDVESLIGVLTGDDWQARQEATVALVGLGSDAVPSLLGVLSDVSVSWEARGHAAIALGEIGDASAFDPLLSALQDGDWHVRGYAGWALGRFRDPRAVAPLLRALDEDENEHCSVRNWIVESLGEIGDRRALTALRAVEDNDPDAGIRASARRAIHAIESA